MDCTGHATLSALANNGEGAVFPKPQPHTGARQQGDVVSKPASSMGVNPQVSPSAEVLDTGWAPRDRAVCSQHRLSICFSTQNPGGGSLC